MKPIDSNLEKRRIRHGPMSSDASYGNKGGPFLIRCPFSRRRLLVIISNQEGWEHVSVSVVNKPDRPSWDEMNFVKDLFWRPDECVVQYHPPKSNYINIHSGTLHLWRPVDKTIPMPPLYMV